uniref:DNA-directed RNA polymerases I, II, and III subunit RPABC3 n=1 Tax=Lotharella vacuolata TaxID=74820 RepID=A0A0H5BKC1_9EUKA|nr:putative RNA polymerase II subunit [Lotharella vacuolata]
MNNLLVCRDLFKIVAKDFDGKKYEKTSRILMQSFFNDIEIWIDIHSYYFPVTVGDILTVGVNICPGSNVAEIENLVYKNYNKYSYLMVGIIFSIQSVKFDTVKRKIIYASFGGLLMKMIVPLKNNNLLHVGKHVIIYITKI